MTTYTIHDVHLAYTNWLAANDFAQRMSELHPKDNSGVIDAWQREAQALERYEQISFGYFDGEATRCTSDS
jgi:hypothetical protein